MAALRLACLLVLSRGSPASGARAMLVAMDGGGAQTGLVRSGTAQVSNLGRFRSRSGVVHRGVRIRIDGRRYRLGQLICEAWHGPRPTPQHTVSFNDLDPSNCRAGNLHWALPSEDSPTLDAGAMSKPGTEEIDEEIEGETWRPVVLEGVESGAHVSDRGRFRDVRGVVKSATGRGDGGAPEAWQVGINGRLYYSHRLICTAWHGPAAHEHQVGYRDLNPSNKTPSNLYWHIPDSNPCANEPSGSQKGRANAMSKPVLGRKVGTEDEWRTFESTSAAAQKLGPSFDGNQDSIWMAANCRQTHTGGWTFEFPQDYEDIPGEVWKDVVLLPRKLATGDRGQ
mmetsp:Transcript_32377/g.80563  ORF Transcript_32377/g.80563 Transcript_32377/m.80563 type:complete len:339 (-) Transcript_32377:52-1068(-)